jgi:hypothetical protein
VPITGAQVQLLGWPAALQAGPLATAPSLADAPALQLGLNHPSQIQTAVSETISLTLTTSAGVVLATVGTPGQTTLVVSPVPLGTPGAPLPQARGTNYAAFAVARIPATTGVQVVLSSPSNEEQALERESITWYWSVTSATAGTRHMRLNLELRYKPRLPGAPSVADEPLWSPEIVIEAREKDVISVGPLQLPTANLGQTIVQIGLTSQLPLLIAWLRARIWTRPPNPPPPPRRRRGSRSAS